MKQLFVLCTFISLAAVSYAQEITGDWNGTLHANGAELRLVLHLSKNPDGSLKATLDSVDQGANGIPVSSATLKDSKLSLAVAAVNGTYEGKVNADASEISGTWTQAMPLELNFHRGGIAAKPAPKPAKPSDIDGDWQGTLDTPKGKLRLVLHIVNTDQGLTATMDSLDQGAMGLPVTTITRTESSLTFEMKTIGGSYDGTIKKDLSGLDGTWKQGGQTLPLAFQRQKNASQLGPRPRPQDPVKPYPYREEEVSYQNPAANIQLSGTITIPSGRGRFPAVLLMQGSGPHDRDETVFGHKPFLVLADYLTRKGIVVLRADKRGIGKSGGDYSRAAIQDFASDGDAGVAYLATRPEVDRRKIGLIGHSEGGIEAPLAAVHNREVAFVVMMAGMGVSGDQLLPEQLRLIEQANGAPADQIDKDVAAERELLAAVEKDRDDVVLEKDLREKWSGKLPDQQLNAQIKLVSSPWFRSLLEYDPAATLAKLSCPVLALNGEKDLQVPPQQNLPPIREALEARGNHNYEIDELPGLNHLFQTAKTGAIGEYGEIEETMSPVAMEKVASWIFEETAGSEKSMTKAPAE